MFFGIFLELFKATIAGPSLIQYFTRKMALFYMDFLPLMWTLVWFQYDRNPGDSFSRPGDRGIWLNSGSLPANPGDLTCMYYNSMNTNEYWYRTLSLFKLEKHDGFQSLSCAWSASIRGLHLHLYSPGDTMQPCLTPRSILNHSVSPLLVRTTDSCSLYRFANSLAPMPRRSAKAEWPLVWRSRW